MLCRHLRKMAACVITIMGAAFWPQASATDDLPPSRADRIKKAEHISEQVRRVSDVLAVPRPADITWIDAEQAEIAKLSTVEAKNARFVKLYETPEFQHKRLYDELRGIHEALDCIKGPRGKERRQEVLCWAVLSYQFADRDTWGYAIHTLHRTGRLPSDIVSRAKVTDLDSFALQFRVQSKLIMADIVLPYLRGQLQ
jgi:hypothetical protein